MHPTRLHALLTKVARRQISVAGAVAALKRLPFENLEFVKVDHHRHLRQGFPEVVFGEGKSQAQIVAISRTLWRQSGTALITRVGAPAVRALRTAGLPVRYHTRARCAVVSRHRPPAPAGRVAVLTAGTADIPVAEEAAVAAAWMGARVEKIYDVGVAGIHRLLVHYSRLSRARCAIVAAGMEGALPSVVGGLVPCPVIAVPTSVGYGVAWRGLTALAAMLSTCSPNVLTVNIDNGFSAGLCAGLINRLGARLP